MEMEGNSGGWKEGNNSLIPDNQANDESQTTICKCSPLQIRREVEEAVKREIQTSTQTLIRQVEEVVLKGNEASILAQVEELRGLRKEVEEIRRVFGTSLPLMQSSNRPSNSRQSYHMEVSQASSTLHLQFWCPSQPFTRIFTCKSLREQGICLQVVLKDDSGKIVEAGVESSMKIKIVVLRGDFSIEEDGDDGFSRNKFHENVLQQRDNKPPLLAGKCEMALDKGVADVDNIMFTDNSSWTRNKKFKLGVEVVKGVYDGVTVKVGTSEDFEVKERRGETYQKKGTPALNDEVWRLHNIARDGKIHTRLKEKNINSVKDLLQMHHANADSLKEILQVKDKKSRDIIEHAKSALSAHSNSIQPGYYISSIEGKDAMPQAYEIPNELYGICGLKYHSSLPTDSYLPATNASVNTLLDVATANSDNLEMQLRMVCQQQDAMHIFPDLSTKHLSLTTNNLDRFQEIENDLRACVSNTLPTVRCGSYKRRWRSVGVALRFSVFRIALNRQTCRARKKQKYY